MPQLRTMVPDLPERGYEIFQEEFLKVFAAGMPDYMTGMIEIYAARFSLAEIEYLAQFYATPTGQKYISELPALTQEVMTFGQQWGSRLGEQAGRQSMERMRDEGWIE